MYHTNSVSAYRYERVTVSLKSYDSALASVAGLVTGENPASAVHVYSSLGALMQAIPTLHSARKTAEEWQQAIDNYAAYARWAREDSTRFESEINKALDDVALLLDDEVRGE